MVGHSRYILAIKKLSFHGKSRRERKAGGSTTVALYGGMLYLAVYGS